MHRKPIGSNWGKNGTYLSSVEVIKEEKKLGCKLDPFPYGLYKHSATIIPTGILVCGGYSSSYRFTKRCYEYKKTTGSWESFPSMTTSRYSFDMKFLNQGVWAIGGYFGSKNSGSKNTLDNYNIHTRVWTKHKIPFVSLSHHCLTKLTQDKLIVLGGYQIKPPIREVSKNEITKIFELNNIFHITPSFGQK